MSDEIANILGLLRHTYEKHAWHGPAVKEVLENISAEQAKTRLPGTHSIEELVAHMTAWRTFVTRKLEGDLDYKVADESNFPTSISWPDALSDLDISQTRLLAAVTSFDVSKLHEKVAHANNDYTYYTLMHGIIHHDLYHIGQIALIVKQTI